MMEDARSPHGATGRSNHPAGRFQPNRSSEADDENTGEGRGVDDRVRPAQAIAETLSTTFGPNGLDKMLIDRSGTVVVTNTGSTVLDGLEIDEPTGRVLRTAVETQARRIGDGSTTMALLVGDLLASASDLIESGLHPTSVIDGYLTAGAIATDHVVASGTPVATDETATLRRIATTAITGRWDDDAAERLARIAVQALERVAFDPAQLTLHAYPGGGVADAQHVDGILIDTDVSSTDIDATGDGPDLPTTVQDPSVALVDGEVSRPELDAPTTVSVTDPEELDRVREYERRMSEELVDAITAVDADVVVCQREIDDQLRKVLARRGVLTVERARRDEFDAIARATGADPVTTAADLHREALGHAGELHRQSLGSTPVLTITGLPDEQHASVILRGGTDHVAEETRRIVDDCIQNIRQAVHGEGVVPGGGAAFLSASRAVADQARSVDDRSQFAITAFADAMEVVPRTLARNAGADPIDTLAALRARHNAGDTDVGIGRSGTVQDMATAGVIEPAAVVSGCLTTAVETAVTLLRIDDVFDAEGTDGMNGSSEHGSHDHGHDHTHDGHGHDHGEHGSTHGGYPWAVSH